MSTPATTHGTVEPAFYDAAYYGIGPDPPKSNYRNYGPPNWARPLAMLLLDNAQGPYLDVGAAFGDLMGQVTELGRVRAVAVDISRYATVNGRCPLTVRASGLNLPFPDGAFGCVVTMDYLEHFDKYTTMGAYAELVKVTRPGGLMVHLVGCPDQDPGHYNDPSHLNHEPMAWYRRLADPFFRTEAVPEFEELLNTHPLWSEHWGGRWMVHRRVPRA